MQMYNSIWNALQVNLNHEETTDQQIIKRIMNCICHVQNALNELKNEVIKNGFKHSLEEIGFFKYELPKFYALYLHYTRIHQIESRIPPGNELKFLERQIRWLATYFDRHTDWVLYYRSGATHLDERYFLRQSTGDFQTIFCPVVLDSRFTTYGTYPFSKLQSLELTQSYLDQRIAHIKNPPIRIENPKAKTMLRWTASKSDLIELLYALHSSRLFNNDDYLDVRQIANWLEGMLNIDLGNFYRVFQGIRIRKKNRTQFLDSLKENLIRRMDEADENPRN